MKPLRQNICGCTKMGLTNVDLKMWVLLIAETNGGPQITKLVTQFSNHT